MSQHLPYFFSALAQSIAAIIAFSIAAIIFYKRRVEEQVKSNVSVYKQYVSFSIPESDTSIVRQIERSGTSNAFNVFLQILFWKDIIEAKLKGKEADLKSGAKLDKRWKDKHIRNSKEGIHNLKIGREALENIEFCLISYRLALLRFWESFVFAILTILFSLLPLCLNCCANQSCLFVKLSIGCAIITIVFIVSLLFQIFIESKQKDYFDILRRNIDLYFKNYSKSSEKLEELNNRLKKQNWLRRQIYMVKRDALRNLWNSLKAKKEE